MPYKQNPKSPILKALVGNQHKLPQHLQDAIKAAPESPAKKKGPTPAEKKKAAQANRRPEKLLKLGQSSADKYNTNSPAKKDGPGGKKKALQNNLKGATVGAARQLLKEAGINDPNISPSNVLKYAKQKGYLQEATNMAKQGLKQKENNFTFGDSSKKKYL